MERYCASNELVSKLQELPLPTRERSDELPLPLRVIEEAFTLALFKVMVFPPMFVSAVNEANSKFP